MFFFLMDFDPKSPFHSSWTRMEAEEEVDSFLIDHHNDFFSSHDHVNDPLEESDLSMIAFVSKEVETNHYRGLPVSFWTLMDSFLDCNPEEFADLLKTSLCLCCRPFPRPRSYLAATEVGLVPYVPGMVREEWTDA